MESSTQLQVGVKVILQNSAGKFLLLERNLDKYPDMNATHKWDLVGGRIIPGTRLIENIKREIFEETQLSFDDEPKLILAQDILRPGKHTVRLTFTGRLEGEPKLAEEHSSYKWFTVEEIKIQKDLDPFFVEAFEFFLKNKS